MPSDESQTNQFITESLVAQAAIFRSTDGRYLIEVHTPQRWPSLEKLLDTRKMQKVARFLGLPDNYFLNNSESTR